MIKYPKKLPIFYFSPIWYWYIEKQITDTDISISAIINDKSTHL